MMHLTIGLLTLASVLPAGPARSGTQDTGGATGNCETLSGVVARGNTFRRRLASGLEFRLVPEGAAENPPGWTAGLFASDSDDRDLTLNATPPYRSSNPRIIGTSSGSSAAEAVAWSERSFRFVTRTIDDEALASWVDVVLWPESYAEQTIDEVERRIADISLGQGLLRILDARLSPASPEHPLGRIEELRFEVRICPPQPRTRARAPDRQERSPAPTARRP